jgi:hypothetical protein
VAVASAVAVAVAVAAAAGDGLGVAVFSRRGCFVAEIVTVGPRTGTAVAVDRGMPVDGVARGVRAKGVCAQPNVTSKTIDTIAD